MDYRLAIVLDATGRVQQTAVLAEDPAGRAAGHRLLQLLEPEVAVFAERARAVLERDREAN